MIDDANEELSRVAIRQALEQYGYYFETISPGDGARTEQLGRLGRAVAADLGVEVSMAVRPRRRDTGFQVCLTVVSAAADLEPA